MCGECERFGEQAHIKRRPVGQRLIHEDEHRAGGAEELEVHQACLLARLCVVSGEANGGKTVLVVDARAFFQGIRIEFGRGFVVVLGHGVAGEVVQDLAELVPLLPSDNGDFPGLRVLVGCAARGQVKQLIQRFARDGRGLEAPDAAPRGNPFEHFHQTISPKLARAARRKVSGRTRSILLRFGRSYQQDWPSGNAAVVG